LSRREWEEASTAVRQRVGGGELDWPADRIEAAMAPFYERFDRLVFDHHARLADKTVITPDGDKRWRATQTLCDPEGEDLWHVAVEIDLTDVENLDGPLITVTGISA